LSWIADRRPLYRAPGRANGTDREGLYERVREFRDCVDIAEIAVMLGELLDDSQIYPLVTMLRKKGAAGR
jgi:hypothetical protein